MQHKDAVLKQVQAAIEQATRIDPQQNPIALSLNEGALALDGEVAHIGTKKLALHAAAGVPGVERIVDRLRVAAGEPPGDGATRDAVCKWLLRDIDFQNCALRVRNKGDKGELTILRDAGADSAGSIEIAVADGVVTLAGQVISLSHKRLAGVLAWWSRGCRDVVNELDVQPPEEDNDEEIVEALHLVFESDPYVHAGQIGIGCRDGTVTLQGIVGSAGERMRAELDAWYLFAVQRVINRLEVA